MATHQRPYRTARVALVGSPGRTRGPQTGWFSADVGMGVGIGLLVLVTSMRLWELPPRDWGFRWSRLEPPCALATVERLGLSGRALSTYANGWLLYRRYPAVRIGLDWDFVFGQARWAEWQEVWRQGAAGLQAYFERYGVGFLLGHTPSWHVIAGLQQRGWVLVHLDDLYFIMVPPRSDREALIQRKGFRFIVLWDNLPSAPRMPAASSMKRIGRSKSVPPRPPSPMPTEPRRCIS
jgi:hypothetical protein